MSSQQGPEESQFGPRPYPESETPPRGDPLSGAAGRPVPAKADVMKRLIAALIDAVIAGVISLVPMVGGLAAAAYFLFRDGLDLTFMPNRSLGKQVMKLQPIHVDGSPVDLVGSAKRNWPFALGGLVSVLIFIPIIGWLLIVPVALAALVLAIVEIVLVITDPEGRRLGDKIANTRVIELAD